MFQRKVVSCIVDFFPNFNILLSKNTYFFYLKIECNSSSVDKFILKSYHGVFFSRGSLVKVFFMEDTFFPTHLLPPLGSLRLTLSWEKTRRSCMSLAMSSKEESTFEEEKLEDEVEEKVEDDDMDTFSSEGGRGNR